MQGIDSHATDFTPDECGRCLALTIQHDRPGEYRRRFCSEHAQYGEAYAAALEAKRAAVLEAARGVRKAKRKAARSGNPAVRAGAR